MQNTEIIPPQTELLSTEAAAAFLNLRAKRTLDNWRSLGCGPRFIKLNKAVRYRRSDLVAWIDANTHQHTGERAAG